MPPGAPVHLRGRERLDAAIASGAGVVVVTAHLGNFSVAPLYAAVVGVPSTVAMEELQPPALYDLIAGLRAGTGVRVAPAGPSGLRAMLATLRRGEPLVLVGDRDITGTGVDVTFFGRPARLPSGPAFLAHRTGAILLPMYTVRIARDRSVVRVLEPIEPARTGDRDADVIATTTRLAAVLETAIRAAPEQWVVLQSVWRGDGSVAGSSARRRRRHPTTPTSRTWCWGLERRHTRPGGESAPFGCWPRVKDRSSRTGATRADGILRRDPGDGRRGGMASRALTSFRPRPSPARRPSAPGWPGGSKEPAGGSAILSP